MPTPGYTNYGGVSVYTPPGQNQQQAPQFTPPQPPAQQNPVQQFLGGAQGMNSVLNPAPASQQDIQTFQQAQARAAGFTSFNNGVASMSQPGYAAGGSTQVNRPLSSFGSPPQQNALGQAGRLIGAETQALQGSLDTRFSELNRLRGQFEQVGNQNAQTISDFGNRNADMLNQYASRLTTLGPEALARFDQTAGQVTGDVNTWLNRGYAGAQTAAQTAAAAQAQSTGTMARTLSDFRNQDQTYAASLAVGMQRQYQSARQQVMAGVGADGAPMTPQEQQAQLASLDNNFRLNVAQQIDAHRMQFNQQVASLGTQLAGLQEQAGLATSQAQYQMGQTAIQAAGIAGQVGTQLAGLRTDLEARNQQLWGVAAGVAQAAASIQMAAQWQSFQARTMGLQASAQLLEASPVVSYFSGLMTLLAAQSAPNAGRVGAQSFGSAGGGSNSTWIANPDRSPGQPTQIRANQRGVAA